MGPLHDDRRRDEVEMDDDPAQRARAAIDAAGLPYELAVHGPVRSLEEAAAARGLTPDRILKSLVVRRADDDFLFVLVPGGRTISWPKLRALLGVSRLSMPDAAVALEVTGYPRGTITPFGSAMPWPVIADVRMAGREVSLGAGSHGVAVIAAADDIIRVLDARAADVTDPEE